jgi:hypothetical protein
MPTKIKQVKDWLEVKKAEAQAVICEVGNGNLSITSETVIANVARMQMCTETRTFIDTLGDDV